MLTPPPSSLPQLPTSAPVPTPITKESEATKKKPVGRGRLRILVNPWGNVFVDGKAWGQTPFKARELPSGEHVVRAENPDAKKAVSKRVVVTDGRETIVELSF